MKHQYYTAKDADIPQQICDRNGDVVLSMCKHCRRAEDELTEDGGECPAVQGGAIRAQMFPELEEYPTQERPRSPRTVPQLLSSASDLFQARNTAYGDDYKHFGDLMAAFFPDGLTVAGPEAFARLGVFVQCASKMGRYAKNLQAGGHTDSAFDLINYAAMLTELTANPMKVKKS